MSGGIASRFTANCRGFTAFQSSARRQADTVKRMQGREWLRWWLWSLAVWLTFGVLDGTQVVVGMRAEGMHHPWLRLFGIFALSWLVWAVASPVVLFLGKRFPLERNWAIHIGSYLAIGIAHGAWTVWLELALQPMGAYSHGFTVVNAILSFFYSKFHLDLIAYAGVLALANTLESRKVLAEREEQLSKARLDVLRRQMEPHFLFNTLNGIAGLVRARKNDTAVEMIAGLSDLLRRVVEGPEGMETSLAEEIEFLEKYLQIQHMRFASRLRVGGCSWRTFRSQCSQHDYAADCGERD